MASGRVTVEIDRMPAEVFAVLADVGMNARWSAASIEGHKITPGPVAVGTRAREVSQFMGRRIEVTSEIVEFEADRRLAYVTSGGPFPFRGSFELEPRETGTLLTASFEVRPTGLLRLVDGLLARLAARQFTRDLGNLKRLMEAGLTAAPGE